MPGSVQGKSNGESGFLYFTEKIRENALYLLDEPENSLSASLQVKLAQFLEDSARFYGCQFVISTHSPFLLAMKGAKIYDLDSNPVAIRKWTELEAVRLYHDFFEKHRELFGKYD
jgi:predicted ATPase